MHFSTEELYSISESGEKRRHDRLSPGVPSCRQLAPATDKFRSVVHRRGCLQVIERLGTLERLAAGIIGIKHCLKAARYLDHLRGRLGAACTHVLSHDPWVQKASGSLRI